MKKVLNTIDKYMPVILWSVLLISSIQNEIEYSILFVLLIINENLERFIKGTKK